MYNLASLHLWSVCMRGSSYVKNISMQRDIQIGHLGTWQCGYLGKVRTITCWLSACRSGSWAAPGLGSHPWHCHCSGWLRVPGATSRSTVFGYQTSDFTTSDQRSQFYHKLVLHIQSNKWLMPRMVLQFSRGILSRRPYPDQDVLILVKSLTVRSMFCSPQIRSSVTENLGFCDLFPCGSFWRQTRGPDLNNTEIV